MIRIKKGARRKPAPPKEFAVVGLGRFGTSLATTLAKSGHSVLGIDTDMNLVQRHSHEISQTVCLDSTDREALQEIDISSYPVVVVAIGSSFESNLMTTVALKSLGVQTVICKATSLTQRDILLAVGADRVVLPEYDAGARLAEEITMPAVLGNIVLSGNRRISEIKAGAKLVGQTLAEIDLPGEMGLAVVAIQRGDETIVSPTSEVRLCEGDLLVVIGDAKDIQRLGNGH
ncbi:MAG: TrkA family potassium uptake protein [Fimbriimonadaceae bacterium]